ncbi:MAG: hypothetical protein ACRD6I_20040, partial [Candidatus Acidiferrales bacterium]
AALVATRDRSGAADAPPALPKEADDRAAATSEHPPAEGRAQSHKTSSVGDRLLMQTAAQLERRGSVSARLRHQVFIGGNHLYGLGSYWQQGSGAELRVRLELQIAGQEASLLQVSNSRFLWVDRQLPTGRSVSRIDLRQLRADPVLSGTGASELVPGEATWSSLQPQLLAHYGGLPSLLAALRENFSFLPPQAMRLATHSPPGSASASIPVFAVVGHWKQEKLLALVGRSHESSAESHEPESLNAQLSTLNSLPNRLPQEVLLLVGQGDLFPYRIEYRRLETPLATSRDALPIPYQLSPNPLVVLELADVAFDVPIAAGQFDYAPGDADWVDQTAALLERLRRERQEQLATRRGNDQRSLPTR